jgi:aspartate racemase
MDNHIVILGGMGPQASLRLHRDIIERFSAKFPGSQPDEFPAILHASLPVPDFIASEKRYEEALGLVRAACEQLPLQQAAAVGIACNTAHLMVNRLPLAKYNFVSMIDAVVEHAQKSSVQKVGLLASPHTVRSKLYEDVFRGVGITMVLPNNRELRELHDIITSVISGVLPQELEPRLSAIARRMHAAGADSVLLGCTELPLVGVDVLIPVIDSVQVLADALLEKTIKTKV